MSDQADEPALVVEKRARRVVAAKRVAKATAHGATAELPAPPPQTSDVALVGGKTARPSNHVRMDAKHAPATDDALVGAKPPRASNVGLAGGKTAKRASNDGLVAADSLARVANKLRAMPARRANADDAAASLARVAKRLGARKRTAKERADDAYVVEREPFDLHLPARPVSIELVGGRAHYERVIGAVMQAHTSVWIATANVKGMMVEGAARPGQRRTQKHGTYVSMVSRLDELASRGIEMRLLHAELPSGPFREEIAAHPRLLDRLELARCPRVHLKAVIVDGALLYLGSANWTGAGLGAKGSGKRNFELGVITDDAELLDQVQALFERVWSGAECKSCKLRDVCPGPLDERDAPEVVRSRRPSPVPAVVPPANRGRRAKRSRRVARSSRGV